MVDIGVVMSQLGMFIVTVCSAVFLYQLIILQIIYLLLVRKNPFKFYIGLLQSWMTAFATASTAAALPVTFRCMKTNNNVDERISKFVLPIGKIVELLVRVKVELKSRPLQSSQVKNYSPLRGIDLEQTLKLVLHPPTHPPPTHPPPP